MPTAAGIQQLGEQPIQASENVLAGRPVISRSMSLPATEPDDIEATLVATVLGSLLPMVFEWWRHRRQAQFGPSKPAPSTSPHVETPVADGLGRADKARPPRGLRARGPVGAAERIPSPAPATRPCCRQAKPG